MYHEERVALVPGGGADDEAQAVSCRVVFSLFRDVLVASLVLTPTGSVQAKELNMKRLVRLVAVTVSLSAASLVTPGAAIAHHDPPVGDLVCDAQLDPCMPHTTE